jgi:hypothetical protein
MIRTCIPGNYNDFCDWLVDNGFFTAPASANHHGNHEGGLFEHSCTVAETLADLTKDNDLHWASSRSPYIVGMFHDLCKIDQYVISKDGYERNKKCLLDGHGDKSILLLAQHMRLTEEEVLCIRWHMGAFDDTENWKHYTAAVRKYPNVLFTHTADMIAAHVLEV